MMRFKILTVVLALTSACVEYPIYDHAPTKQLYRDFDLDAPELVPFTHDGVTVGVGMTSGHAIVHVYFSAKTAASVTVDEVRVAGLGAQADATATAKPIATLELTEWSSHPGFFGKQSDAPFEAPASGVDAMTAEGAVVTVTWRVADGSPTTTELRIDRRMTRDIAWPT